jgi:hypothetical protein
MGILERSHVYDHHPIKNDSFYCSTIKDAKQKIGILNYY